jgi:polyisoprenoid-binding protein YceI
MQRQGWIRSLVLMFVAMLSFGAATAFAGEPEVTAEAAAVEQYVRFVIDHADSSKGLVTGEFKKFEVKKAVIDAAALEKSVVEVEIDIASVDTGNKGRDAHLQNADFFDAPQFPKATLTVKDAKADGDAYTATASLSLHGLSKEFPVKFKVVEKRDDGSIIIEGSHDMTRSLFSIGGPPEASGAAEALTVQVRLHLKST